MKLQQSRLFENWTGVTICLIEVFLSLSRGLVYAQITVAAAIWDTLHCSAGTIFLIKLICEPIRK